MVDRVSSATMWGARAVLPSAEGMHPPHFRPVGWQSFPTFHRSSCSHTTVFTSMVDPVFIFKDGKLKPGIYKIQNIVGQTRRVEVCGLPP